MSTNCFHSHISIYPILILFTNSKHVLYSLDPFSKLWIQSKRLVTISVSLCTQTGSHYLTIQVLNTIVCFIVVWYSSVTSVHNNLEHGLVIVTYLISFIYMSTHKASAAKCLREHQAWSRQPAIWALPQSSLRRLALSKLFTSQSTSYQTMCTVSERSSIKGTHQCKPTWSSSFTLKHLVSISMPPCGTLYTYT